MMPPISPLRSSKVATPSPSNNSSAESLASSAVRTPANATTATSASVSTAPRGGNGLTACTPLSAERKRRQAEREQRRLLEAQRSLDEIVGGDLNLAGLDEDAFMDELVDGVVLCDYVNNIMVGGWVGGWVGAFVSQPVVGCGLHTSLRRCSIAYLQSS